MVSSKTSELLFSDSGTTEYPHQQIILAMIMIINAFRNPNAELLAGAADCANYAYRQDMAHRTLHFTRRPRVPRRGADGARAFTKKKTALSFSPPRALPAHSETHMSNARPIRESHTRMRARVLGGRGPQRDLRDFHGRPGAHGRPPEGGPPGHVPARPARDV